MKKTDYDIFNCKTCKMYRMGTTTFGPGYNKTVEVPKEDLWIDVRCDVCHVVSRFQWILRSPRGQLGRGGTR